MMCKSSLFCIPPISKRYEPAALLSIYKWVAIFDCPFVNISITNFAAINSGKFMYKFSSFSDR